MSNNTQQKKKILVLKTTVTYKKDTVKPKNEILLNIIKVTFYIYKRNVDLSTKLFTLFSVASQSGNQNKSFNK